MMRVKTPIMGLFCALTLAACGPVGSPSANADHGAAQPANGIIANPPRPDGVPANALQFNWHVAVHDGAGHLKGGHAAIVRITANSPNAQVQGNVYGGYPFRIYTLTPYTHTIWYQPGIKIITGLTATADPELPDGWYVECTASTGNRPLYVRDYTDDPQICIMSYTIEG